MKLIFCVEGDFDEQVYASLLRKVTGSEVEVEHPQIRVRRGGFDLALKQAPIAARAAHASPVDGVLFAIDNDGKPAHSPSHKGEPDCRVCMLRKAAKVDEVLKWPRPELPPLKFFFVVPVQTIETWLLLVKGWDFKGRQLTLGKDSSGRAEMKQALYAGRTDAQSWLEVALPLIASMDVAKLEALSPSFKQFAADARAA